MILHIIIFISILSILITFQALIVEEPSSEPKESNPANLVSLKTHAAALRDQIYSIEKEEEMKGEAKSAGNRRFSNVNSTTGSIGGESSVSGVHSMYHSSKASRKQRDKLAIIEADIVLAAPQLLFQVCDLQMSLLIIPDLNNILKKFIKNKFKLNIR